MSGPAPNSWAARYDEAAGRWKVVLRRADGTERTLHPRHVIIATGVSGIPSRPGHPVAARISAARCCIPASSTTARPGAARTRWCSAPATAATTSRRTCTPAARRRRSCSAARPWSSTSSRARSLTYALYDEGPPLEDCDLIATSMPLSLARKSHIAAHRAGEALDQQLIDGLERTGFQLDFGEDGTGQQFKYLPRGGGYYFNVGCSDLIVEGKIGLLAVFRHRRVRGRRRADAQRRDARRRSARARDRLPGPGASGAQAVRRRRRRPRRPDLGLRRRTGAAQHVQAHAAAGPVVHRRQLRAMPHLFEISRAADQGVPRLGLLVERARAAA